MSSDAPSDAPSVDQSTLSDGVPPAAPMVGEISFSQREVRKQRGKDLRQLCPRSSHTTLDLDPMRDPIALLEESNCDRLKQLLPVRFTRMLESPFAFFRGTAGLQAYDLLKTPTTGISVQCCGDCHLMNFGGFATPERTLIFDINDFDETHPGPFEWDIKRLATSFVLAARWLRYKKSEARDAVGQMVKWYREGMAQFAEMSVLETWYARITYEGILESVADNPVLAKHVKKQVAKAQVNTSEHVYEKLTREVNGKPQIALSPPLLFRPEDHDQIMQEHVVPFFEKYRATLSGERQMLFDRYQLVDFAYKVVGVGSVGTRCFIVLFIGNQDDPLFLQVKEARRSVLAGRYDATPHDHDGERVVTGQRLMQSASDIFLGWTDGPKGRSYYVRQLRDMKVAPDLRNATPEILAGLAGLCGRTLARAHAKTGDAATIAGYLGGGTSFDEAITEYAEAYADQVERDFETFQMATRTGRLPVETIPGDVEETIR
ncbi:MAG: DUF2252 domain-containing protein [Planctomycetales bacterium]